MKPGAPLFMVWHSTSHSPYRSITDDIRPWELKLKQLNESLDPRSYHPVFETEEWKDVFENTHIKSNDGLFSVPLSQSTISSTRKFTRDAMWNLVECYSYVAALEPERLSVSLMALLFATFPCSCIVRASNIHASHILLVLDSASDLCSTTLR